MNKKVALSMVLAALAILVLVACAGAANAQEVEKCDASLELYVLGECLVDNPEGEGNIGYGILKVKNTGAQGVVTVTLQAFFTENVGTGTITPNEVTFELGPGEEWQTIFSVIPETASPDGSVQIRWEVTAASCRSDHNVGKGDTTDFEGCPTVINLTSLTTTWLNEKQENPVHWSAPFLGLGALVGLGLIWKFAGNESE